MSDKIASSQTPMGQLAVRLGADVVVTSGPAYEETLRIWNGAVTSRPAVVVRARTSGDVQAAVLAAREQGLPLSVRGGGHDWAGRSLRDGGLTIDLTGMRQVAVDPSVRVATVGGGATAMDLLTATTPHGLVGVTGAVGAVGLVGLTLGGGYGPLNGAFGLALDNLVGADLVLADGRLVTADLEHEPELFWAVRGGGGNFGVVTSMRLRLHPLEQILGGLIAYPWTQAGRVLDQLTDILADAPDELTVPTAILTGPDGAPGIFLVPTWAGPPAAGEPHLEALQRLGTPVLTQVAPMSFVDLVHLNDAQGAVTGHHYTARTRTVPGMTPGVVDALVRAGDSLSSPRSVVPVHHFHGVAAGVPLDSTAFGLRRDHLMIEIVAMWEPGDATPHQAWADSVADELADEALPGGYPNMLGPEHLDQIVDAYGPHVRRLRAAKARYDPDGIFTAIPLP